MVNFKGDDDFSPKFFTFNPLVLINAYSQSDQSQIWLMNTTLRNVKYPMMCIKTLHGEITNTYYTYLRECRIQEPKPSISKRFYLEPALDKNGKQLCDD